jgi:SnoaL-like domain
MELRTWVRQWFDCWEDGDYHDIPVTDDFIHTSPYGTIRGREAYIGLVDANRDDFLGYRFEVLDEIHTEDIACVRYAARSGDFTLEASEWFFAGDGGIARIISYFDVGQVPPEPSTGGLAG